MEWKEMAMWCDVIWIWRALDKFVDVLVKSSQSQGIVNCCVKLWYMLLALRYATPRFLTHSLASLHFCPSFS